MKKKEEQEILWRDRKHHLWFPFSFTKYYIQNGRLHQERGLLSTVHEETILYRITDITLKRTLAHKIFGTGTIVLKVQADSHPVQHLVNIKYPEDVRSYLSDLVDEERSSRNVAGREMYGSMGMPHGHGHEGHEGHGGPEYPPPEDAPDIEVPPPPEEI